MLKSYFKIAWRNLKGNKGFTITNLLGLTMGMTCSMLILLWVYDELTFDHFHTNYQHIYQVIANRDFKNRVFTDRNIPFPVANALESSSPQIKHAVVVTYQQDHVLEYGATKLKKQGYTVGDRFFDVFSWHFLEGTTHALGQDPNSILLTASASKIFFGNADPLNKIIRLDNTDNMKVVGVLADPPGNSGFRFDFIKFFNYSDSNTQRDLRQWGSASWNVFIQLVPGANVKKTEKDINALMAQHDPGDHVSSYFCFPMEKWHLYSDFSDGKNTGGMIEYVRLFISIAGIILLIACINFMNLSTARSEKRAREIGVRKTLGSSKAQLRIQFFLESIILVFIAALISILAVLLLLPSFNSLVDKKLSLHPGDPMFWSALIAIILVTGLIAGSYPAFYLSAFNPVRVLKGAFNTGEKAILPRRILVVSQFVISILLISATIIVYQQLKYVKNREIGYDQNNLLMFPATDGINKGFSVFRQDLINGKMVDAVTRTMSPITQIWWRSPSPNWEGKPAGTEIIFSGQTTDIGYAKTMGIKLLKGKDFSGSLSDSSAMLLNRSAIEAMHLPNPVGMKMRYGNTAYTVIGVTDNVVMESPYKPVDPLMVYYNPMNSNTITVRLGKGIDPKKAIPAIQALFAKYSPADIFEYQFVDQEFGKKFLGEELISKIIDIFAGLAIFICCLGLAGLASFTIEKRIREIGIRKVLGASLGQLLMLISKEFLRLVGVAFVIAVPLTWWLMKDWLEKYTYHTHISLWLFGLVGSAILLLTLIVVSLNTISAATANPVKSLRTE